MSPSVQEKGSGGIFFIPRQGRLGENSREQCDPFGCPEQCTEIVWAPHEDEKIHNSSIACIEKPLVLLLPRFAFREVLRLRKRLTVLSMDFTEHTFRKGAFSFAPMRV